VRCDHVAGVDPAFWIELRRGLRAVKPDALVLGEATGHFEWLARYAGRLDAIFDFDFAHVVRQTFGYRRMSLVDFARWMDEHDHALPGLARVTLIDNHDMNRFLWIAGGDKQRLRLAAVLLLTLPGTPAIYYGTEVGLTQRVDGAVENAEARLPMLWGDDQDGELLDFFRRLADDFGPDHETLQAVLSNRYEVMASYAKAVKQAYRQELAHLKEVGEREKYKVMRGARKWFDKEEASLNEPQKRQLPQIFANSQKLRTFIELRNELATIWERSSASREQLLTQLQDWCHRAEQSGIKALQEFASRLRRYA